MIKDFLDPELVLKKLNLKDNFVAADFGCGSGGWAIPLAKMLKKGRVFAIDILEEPLSALRSKLKLEKILNVDCLRCDVERGTTLLSESCDLVLMTNLLFQVEDVKKVMKEGKRVLKQGGKILVVDWKPEAEIGPKEKISKEKVKEIAKELNLKLISEFEAGIYHYGLVFEKK